MKVPGRKTMVTPAMVFMAKLSFRASMAMRLESSAMEMLVRLSAWAIRFWTYILRDSLGHDFGPK